MKRIILILLIILFPINIFAAKGCVEFINKTNSISFKIKFEEATTNKTRGWYKSLKPGQSRKICTEKTISAPDIKDLWVKVYSKENKYLGTFRWSKNINIKNDKTTRIELNWNTKNKNPIRQVYKPGTSKIDEKYGQSLAKKSASEKLIIYNKTYEDIYVATYYQQSQKLEKIGPIIKINARKMRSIKNLKFKILYSRKLVFSYIKEELLDIISGRNYKNITKVGIGAVTSDKFYIAEKDFILHAYNPINWKIIKPTIELISKPLKELKKWIIEQINSGPYSKKTASVYVNKELCPEEKVFLKKREMISQTNLSKLLKKNISNTQVPIIGVACSGGGFRAMISTSGLYEGFEEIGILDSITYGAGISGSTWFLSPWIYYDKSVNNYNKLLKNKVEKNIFKSIINLNPIITAIMEKNLFKDHINIIDFYGGILGNKFFGNTKEYNNKNIHLSELSKKIDDGSKPLPILTAVSPGPPFLWFEYTPYQVGANITNFYVPTWSFGRKFLNGKSQNFAPEQKIGFFMGIWGSAFALKFSSMIKGMLKKLPKGIKSIIEKTMNITNFDKQRLWPAKIKNPVFGLKDNSMRNIKEIKLVDAGEALSLPISVYLRRKPNILFLYDADENKNAQARSLFNIKKWAEKHKFKFPEFVQNEENKKDAEVKKELKEKIKNNTVLIFENLTDKNIPTIIYFALKQNIKFNSTFDPIKETKDGFCNTFNFQYSNKEFDLLSGLLKYNVIENKEKIINAIERKIQTLSN